MEVMELAPALLEEVLLQPCAQHSPLEDDDMNMDDDEVHVLSNGWGRPSADADAEVGWLPDVGVWGCLKHAWTLVCSIVDSVEL